MVLVTNKAPRLRPMLELEEPGADSFPIFNAGQSVPHCTSTVLPETRDKMPAARGTGAPATTLHADGSVSEVASISAS